jgi:hypothetical protein
MTGTHGDSEILLFFAGRSLLSQAGQWVLMHPGYSLRRAASVQPRTVRRALSGAVVVVIDATDWPGLAMAALERALAQCGPKQVAVYTEVIHEGLELFVRVRKALLLLGPMQPTEWEAFFSPRLPAAPPPRAWDKMIEPGWSDGLQ